MSTPRASSRPARRAPVASRASARGASAAADQAAKELPLPADAVCVGRVVDAWGVRGWIRVEPFNAPDESVLPGVRAWWLRRSGAADLGISVERCRPHGAVLVAKPAACEDRDAALALKGREVWVSRADFPPPAEGEFYWVDLVGCEVRNPRGVALGRVEAIDDHGAHPILKLSDPSVPGGRLIPFVDAIVLEVDPAARLIVADWEADY